MKVLIFGILTDVIGAPMLEVEAVDVDSLNKILFAEFPLLKQYSFQIAVNMVKVEKNISLTRGDEVALLPPYSGG